MKLLISNQHGAIVMALMPFLYGMLLSNPVWQHIFLLLAWAAIYLLTYPLLSLFKGRNLELYRKWTLIYSLAALLFVIPALIYNWEVITFAVAMLPLLAINIYHTMQKDERAMGNDLAGIAVFAIAGMCSYYFAERQFDAPIWWVAMYPSLFFVGTTLYVKSVMRERKNPLYLKASIAFHIFCILILSLCGLYALAFAFVPPLIRAMYLPTVKLTVKQVGLIEIGVSLIFFAMLLYATL